MMGQVLCQQVADLVGRGLRVLLGTRTQSSGPKAKFYGSLRALLTSCWNLALPLDRAVWQPSGSHLAVEGPNI